MNQKNKKNIAIAVIALIILAGIVVVNIWGFNKELRFEQSQKIDVYIEEQVDETKVKDIANEVLGLNNIVQTVEVYKDMVTIRAESISEEQKNNIVNKIKESYEFQQTAEEITIDTITGTRIRDMYKQYVFPFLIAYVLVILYMLIRYYKNGILKVFAKSAITPIVAELLLLSIIAITRIPVGRFIPVLIIMMYIASILYVIKENEK